MGGRYEERWEIGWEVQAIAFCQLVDKCDACFGDLQDFAWAGSY